MFHDNRRWAIHVVASAEELAHIVAKRTSTLCSGFVVAGHEDYLFLNDATHEDGAGEYGVIQGGLATPQRYQIESITFSWCSTEQALEYIGEILSGKYDQAACRREVRVAVESASEHGHCPLCA